MTATYDKIDVYNFYQMNFISNWVSYLDELEGNDKANINHKRGKKLIFLIMD